MIKTEILVENEQDKIAVTQELIKQIELIIDKVLKVENFPHNVEISITFVDNERIKEINREHRDKDSETDVLSFPMLEYDEAYNIISDYEAGDYDFDNDMLLLGDIVISLEKAIQQAEEYGHSFEREVGFLTVHSMYHLLGYDHEEDEEAQIMREKEEKILKSLQLVRP